MLQLEGAVSVIHHSPHDRRVLSARRPEEGPPQRQAPPTPLGMSPDLEAYLKLVLKLHYSEQKLHRAQAELRAGGTPASGGRLEPPAEVMPQDSPSFEDGLDLGLSLSEQANGPGETPLPLARSLGDELHAASGRKPPRSGRQSPHGSVTGRAGPAALAEGSLQGPGASPGVTAQHWKQKYYLANYDNKKLEGRVERMTEELMTLSVQVERLQGLQRGGASPPPELAVELRPNRDIVCSKVALLLQTASSSLEQLAASQKSRGEAAEPYARFNTLLADLDGLRKVLEALAGAKGRPALSPSSPVWRAAFSPSSVKRRSGERAPRRFSGGNPFADKQPGKEGAREDAPRGSPSQQAPPSQGGGNFSGTPPPRDVGEKPASAFSFPSGDEPAEGSAGGRTPPGLTGRADGSGDSPVRTPQQLLDAFKAADADGDGCLNSAELQGVLIQLGLEADSEGWGRSGKPLVFSECKKIVLELSQARDGE